MSFLAEDDNNGNNVHVFRDKDLYRNYHLQHFVLARERSLQECNQNVNDKISSHIFYENMKLSIIFIESLNMKLITVNHIHRITQHETL